MTNGEFMYLALAFGAALTFAICVGFVSWWSARK